MSALENYIVAVEAAGIDLGGEIIRLVVETPTRFYAVVGDASGEYEYLLSVFANDDFWGVPVTAGSLEHCLSCLSLQDTLI